MVIDTSALLAILQDEEAAEALMAALAADSVRLISTMSVLEATCVLQARRGPAAVTTMALFLAEMGLEKAAFDETQLSEAQDAWMRFGRGSHPARLNFGDCASYALSRTSGEPLLFVGNDFAQTDITAARYFG